MSMTKCRECSTSISSLAHTCPSCGAPTGSAPAMQTIYYRKAKSKNAAAAWGILLGGLGAHKFYLGQPVQGLLYLLFCWTFIPAIIGFLEGLCYLSFKDEAFQKKYG